MKSSKRANQIQEYYFSKKLEQLRLLEQAGKQIINLGIGSPDLEVHDDVRDTLHSASLEKGSFRYKSYHGLVELRESIRSFYKTSYGLTLTDDMSVLPLIGSKQGIGFISLAYVNEGEAALLPNPGYPTYESATKMAGGRAVFFTLDSANDYQPNLSELEELMKAGCKLLWINYPNMPTGAKARIEVLEQIVELAKKYDVLLCHDNPYSHILNDEPLSIFNIIGAKDVALELNSLSKSHNMAGSRLGMLIGKKELVDPVLRIMTNFSSGMFEPLQRAAITALQLPNSWYSELNAQYKKRRLLAEAICDALGCTYSSDSVGLFLWARIPSDNENGAQLSDLILEKTGVFITPGFIFGSAGEQFIRISLCSSEELLTEALELINTKLK